MRENAKQRLCKKELEWVTFKPYTHIWHNWWQQQMTVAIAGYLRASLVEPSITNSYNVLPAYSGEIYSYGTL